MNESAESAALRGFDPHTQAFAQDPYPIYAAMREQRAPLYYAPFDTWLVSRYVDVQRLATAATMQRTRGDWCSQQERDTLLKADNWHDMPFHSRFIQTSLLDSDGEVHDRLRRQVFMFFAPGPIAGLREAVGVYVNQLLDELLGHNAQFDFIEDLAAHLPGRMIGRLMGVPDADCALLRQWSERIVQFFDIDRSAEKKALAEATTIEFYEYLKDLARSRAQRPADDLITKLLQAQSAEKITEDEFYSTCMLIVMAGHGSTLDALGSGLHSLLRFPAQLSRLQQDSSLVKTAVQEMLRFESPLPFFHRYNAQAIELGGRSFPIGTRFGLLYGAANRDSERFTAPDTFNIGRRPNRHLALGGGAHFCLGNHLAKLNMEVLFERLVQRTSHIALAGGEHNELLYKPGLSARGLQRLPIEVKSRTIGG